LVFNFFSSKAAFCRRLLPYSFDDGAIKSEERERFYKREERREKKKDGHDPIDHSSSE
jgi:hypothetical protein